MVSLLYSQLSGSHFGGGQCHVLPPISHQQGSAGRYGSPTASAEAHKVTQLQRHARQLSAQNSTLKQAVRRNSSMVDSAEATAASLREQLARANEELANARNELRVVKRERDEEILSLEGQLKELRETNATLRAKLDLAVVAKRKVEIENKRTIESIVTRHEKDANNRAERHKVEVQELKEQLEMLVLKAAIDLNRQYRELYIRSSRSENNKKMPPRRATDGCVPLLMEMNISRKNRNVEDAAPPQAVRSSEDSDDTGKLCHASDVSGGVPEAEGENNKQGVYHGRPAWESEPGNNTTHNECTIGNGTHS